MHWLAELSTV